MTAAVIVQARMGSKRLPGKVMFPLADEPVIRHVLRRCQAIQDVTVVCAVPDEPASEPIEKEAQALGVVVVRGSESDVLARYHKAARVVEAETILRVTSDCPLIDPEICRQVLALVTGGGARFASNVIPRGYPKGLDCEAFTMEELAQANHRATDASDREHVTPWIRRHASPVANLNGDPTMGDYRWVLDTMQDYKFLSFLYPGIPKGDFDWRVIWNLLDREVA
jgi:spore coat polysaccharide biosynthesis protein SpsF